MKEGMALAITLDSDKAGKLVLLQRKRDPHPTS